jgi:hypothetical protein
VRVPGHKLLTSLNLRWPCDNFVKVIGLLMLDKVVPLLGQ